MATNNAINTSKITLGGPLTFTGAFTTDITITGNTNVTMPTSGTLLTSTNYPIPGAAAGKIIISDGANWIASTPTYPNAAGAAGKVLQSNGTNFVESTPTYPSTSGAAGKILISDGTNNVYSTPTYPNTSGAAGKILISDGTNNIYSTPTYPNAAGTSGNVMTSNGTNFVSSAIGAWADFTPTVTLVGGAGNTVPTYSINVGRYTKIGNIVFVIIFLSNSVGGTAGAGTGAINIALPVAVSASATTGMQTGNGIMTNTTTFNNCYPVLTASASTITFTYQSAIGVSTSAIGNSQNGPNSRGISLSFFYES